MQPAMRALLLPIKDLRNAKQRLAAALTPDERFGLAQAMLTDTIRAVGGVQRADKIFVVTNYEPAMEIAARNGWDVLREEHQISESASVDYASRLCAERGVTALLRLPLDLPLVQARQTGAEDSNGSSSNALFGAGIKPRGPGGSRWCW